MRKLFTILFFLFTCGFAYSQPNTFPASGPVGIGTDQPLTELHIRDQNDADNDAILFLEPSQWRQPGDFGEIRFGDEFHFIRGENRFGMTINDFNAIFFKTGGFNAQLRMVISSEGNVGIGTDKPSATLHNKGSFRLEELPIGQGEPLVMDKEGNVFVSRGSVNPALETENAELRQEIADLKERLAQIEALLRSNTNQNPSASLVASLQKINPNPFDQDTNIHLFVPQAAQSASLIIYDMQGSPLKTVNIQERGKASIQVQAYSLKSGLYYCALIVDGQEMDVKRMIRK